MSSIPDDIFHDILKRLPVKSLLVCKSVCKNWFELISNPSFVNAHLNLITHRNYFILTRGSCFMDYIAYSNIGYESLNKSAEGVVDMFYKLSSIFASPAELLCSCNGLVGLTFRTDKGYIFLWNPATREYKQLPQPPTRQDLHDPLSALGFDYKINDYKLVYIVKLDEWTCEILVYTLGSNSWKKIQNMSCRRTIHDGQSGVLVNGVFHWLGRQSEDYSCFVVSFDISNERYNDIQLPKEALDRGCCCMCVGVLEGCLCVVARVDDKVHPLQVVVWVMQEYAVRESWSKRYVINHERIVSKWYYLRVMRCFKNGEILFDFLGSDVVIYDPKRECVRDPNVHGLQNICFEQGSYFETLVSLNSGMYVKENGRV